MAQAMAVGLAFVGAILLVSLVFLATGRGGDADAIWVFPVWVLLFVSLIWRSANLRQSLARGMAILGFEMLALPLAWLAYEATPSVDVAGTGPGQALSVLVVGLVASSALFGGSVLAFRRSGVSVVRRAVLGLAVVGVLAEAGYAIFLWVSLLRG